MRDEGTGGWGPALQERPITVKQKAADPGPGPVSRPILVRVRTRRDMQRRIFLLVGLLACLQIVIDSLEPFLGRYVMLFVRLMGALAAAGRAVLFEMYKIRREPS